MDLRSLVTVAPGLFRDEILPRVFSLGLERHFESERGYDPLDDYIGLGLSDFFEDHLSKLCGVASDESDAAEWKNVLRFLSRMYCEEIDERDAWDEVVRVAELAARIATGRVRALSLVCKATRDAVGGCARFHRFAVFCLSLRSAKAFEAFERRDEHSFEFSIWWERLDVTNATAESARAARDRRNAPILEARRRSRERAKRKREEAGSVSPSAAKKICP